MKKVFVLLFLCLAALVLPCPAQDQQRETGALLPVRQNGKWGYIDRKGALLIQPQYDDAWDFSEGLAYARAGNKRFVIDQTGKVLIDLQQVDFAGRFSEGLASVQTSGPNPRRGFIDKEGKLVIAPQFDAVESFEGG
nr:WG repeat-containing protein [Acidobacteriota bacterium]